MNAHSFEQLTQYIPQLEDGTPFATLVRDEPENGVVTLPVIEYTDLAKRIVRAFYSITDNNPDYSMNALLSVYENSAFAETTLTKVDVSEMDIKSVLALFAAVMHNERWDSGTLYSFYSSGKLLECLKRLFDANGV